MKRKRWKIGEKNALFNKDSDKVMRLQDKGNRFIIVDKQTYCEKANEQIERSSFLKIDYVSLQKEFTKLDALPHAFPKM